MSFFDLPSANDFLIFTHPLDPPSFVASTCLLALAIVGDVREADTLPFEDFLFGDEDGEVVGILN